MKRITLIISAVLAGIIIFQYLFNQCEGNKKDRHIAELQLALANCINAPERITIDTVESILERPIQLKPTAENIIKERPVKVIYQKDTIRDTIIVNIPQREYSGTFIHPQFEAHWKAIVTGTLDDLTIQPPSLIKSLVITKEKVLPPTALNKPQGETIREKSHLYATLGSGFNMREINSIDAGLMYIRKEGWGIQLGIGTNFDYLLYRTGLIIKLK